MTAHADWHCVAVGCSTPIARDLVMCGRHWSLLPAKQQGEVLREQQAARGLWTGRFLAALGRAIRTVALQEGRR